MGGSKKAQAGAIRLNSAADPTRHSAHLFSFFCLNMTARLHTPQPYIYIYIYKVSASSACDAQAPAMTAYAPFLLAYAPFALDRLRHMDCRMCMCVCVCVCTFPLRLIHASTTPGQFGSRFRVQFNSVEFEGLHPIARIHACVLVRA